MSDPINEILEFAGNVAADDIFAFDAYVAAPARLTGHVPGLADQRLENAVLRQLSRFNGGVAQFIAQHYAPGVVDDGDKAKIVAGLEAAINALIAAQGVDVEPASETAAGIVELATDAEAIAGTDAVRAITPAALLAALTSGLAGVARVGAVNAYTQQQHNAPVARTGQSGSQAVDMDLHQLLSITATAAIALAAPDHLAVGKTATIMVYSAASVAITYDAAYLASTSWSLPSSTTAGKWLITHWLCHKAGSLLLTGVVEEA